MSVYLPKGGSIWKYDFRFKGRRYHASTGQTRKDDAMLVAAKKLLDLRRQGAGISVFDPMETPRFSDWALVYLRYQRRYVGRADIAERMLQVVLGFWGGRPAVPPNPPANRRRPKIDSPYHDLRLGHPIADPTWLLRFQAWVDARGVSGSTRNSYLSVLSGLYRVALQPEHRSVARIESDPFRDIRRSHRRSRVIALEPAQILAWITEASYHVALTATIAALAPKLRLRTILDLRWDDHFDAELTRITVTKHKTAIRTGAPQVTPISAQLRAILQDARDRNGHETVITYHGEPVIDIKKGARRAAERAGLAWGFTAGVTFHTIRHSIATLLARVGMAERLRMELLGHREIRTTQQYTHLAAEVQVEPHEALSRALPISHIMLAKSVVRAKASRGENRGESDPDGSKTRQNSRGAVRTRAGTIAAKAR